jgi:hypothetical protein
MHLGLLQVQFTHKIQQFTPKSFILAGFGVIWGQQGLMEAWIKRDGI